MAPKLPVHGGICQWELHVGVSFRPAIELPGYKGQLHCPAKCPSGVESAYGGRTLRRRSRPIAREFHSPANSPPPPHPPPRRPGGGVAAPKAGRRRRGLTTGIFVPPSPPPGSKRGRPGR